MALSINTFSPNIMTARQGSLANKELTPEQEKQVQQLKARDQEVRTHENAHKSAGGGYVGSISYTTQTGPDGREYAIGGEAQIDASPIPGKPEATIRKMDIVVRAALAPAEPSSQDYAVARAAQQARLQAQRELSEQERTDNAAQKEENPITSYSSIQNTLLQAQELRDQSTQNQATNMAERVIALANYIK